MKGRDDDELLNGSISFIRKIVKVPEDEVHDNQIERARRALYTRKTSSTLEAVATFSSVFARDRVSAHGKNLRPYFDEQDRPTAGMKIDFPPFLSKTFRILEWYRAEMRRNHGPGTRRNIRFNDDDLSLYLDVKLPGDDHWHRVEQDMAEDFKRKCETVAKTRTKNALEIVSVNNIPLGDRRVMSLTDTEERLLPSIQRSNDNHGRERGDSSRRPRSVPEPPPTIRHGPNDVIYISPKKRT